MRNLIIVATLLITLGCTEESRPLDPGQQQRFANHRQQLQEELGSKYNEPVPQGTAAQLERGARLYAQVCAPCHGPRGSGEGHTGEGLLSRPTALTDRAQAKYFSEQARIEIIRKGIPGSAMMGWQGVLPESDILAVYLYIRSLIGTK